MSSGGGKDYDVRNFSNPFFLLTNTVIYHYSLFEPSPSTRVDSSGSGEDPLYPRSPKFRPPVYRSFRTIGRVTSLEYLLTTNYFVLLLSPLL